MKKMLITGMLVVVFALPVAASAQTSSVNTQIIALLTQIISLQKSLIEGLQTQVTQLKNQIANLNTANANTQQHVCAVVNPPACATALAVTYDEYNCVTNFFCKP